MELDRNQVIYNLKNRVGELILSVAVLEVQNQQLQQKINELENSTKDSDTEKVEARKGNSNG